jgi:hypothetical protein
MSTPEPQQPNESPDEADEADDVPVGTGTPRDEVNDSLPLPNDPVDHVGVSADDLTGEAPD